MEVERYTMEESVWARGRSHIMTLSSKSAQAFALMPIFVAIAEPQLPEPMSATFSGIFAC